MQPLLWRKFITFATIVLTLLCITPLSKGVTVLWPLPGLDVALQKSDSIACAGRNVNTLSSAGRSWSFEHHQFPTNFQQFTNKLSSPSFLYCPANFRDHPITNWNDVAWDQIDYIWTRPSTTDPAEVICACRIHTHTALADGSVTHGTERPGWSYFVAGAVRQDVTPGSNARFEVRIAPDAIMPVHFQWRREDLYYQTNVTFVDDGEQPGFWITNATAKFTVTTLPNQTNSFFLLENVKTNDTAYYTVVASNALGRSISPHALLRVRNAFPTSTEGISQSICVSNLGQIGLLANLWAEEHRDRMPHNFAEMTNRFGLPIFGWPLVLFCRSDTARSAPADWPDFNFEDTSYEIVAADERNIHAVFCRCRIHGFYAAMGGQAISGPSFHRTLFASNPTELLLNLFAERTNILESSSNLTSWATLATFSNTNGPVRFQIPTDAPHLFYRLRLGEDK
jgi:hypothetical protein